MNCKGGVVVEWKGWLVWTMEGVIYSRQGKDGAASRATYKCSPAVEVTDSASAPASMLAALPYECRNAPNFKSSARLKVKTCSRESNIQSS